jgi:hypothetical protein
MGRQSSMAMSPEGPGNNNHCAGEAQQQFSSQLMGKAPTQEDRPLP